MNLREDDWIEFRKLFPGAAAFLDGRELRRERENLQAEVRNMNMAPKRKVWVAARLSELDQLFGDSGLKAYLDKDDFAQYNRST